MRWIVYREDWSPTVMEAGSEEVVEVGLNTSSRTSTRTQLDSWRGLLVYMLGTSSIATLWVLEMYLRGKHRLFHLSQFHVG